MIEIPNYTVDRELGRGGMATVYLAVQDMLSRNVALKIMLPDMARDENFRKSFLSEGKIIASLEHRNIVRIYDVGVIDDSILYMAMEHLANGTLKQKLEQGKLSYAESLRILEQTSSGLDYAHAKGYIHRDIKPGNILFRENDTAVITDFGIAKLQDTSGELTRMGYTMGTVQYMSPEQAVTTDLDHRSDIYSLGLVFYEMLTGQKAFKAESTIQAIHQHTTVAPPELPTEYKFLQPTLDKVLAKEPDDRYQTVGDFVEAVKNAVNVDKTVIHKLPPQIDDDKTQILHTGHYQVPQKEQKSKKGLYAGIVSSLVLVGGLAFGVTNFDKVSSWIGIEQTKKEPSEFVKIDPGMANEGNADQAIADQVKADQAIADQVKADQAIADQVKADQAIADQAIADQVKADQAIADQIKADQAIADQVKADQAIADQAIADQAIADQIKADQVKADQAIADQVKADQVKAELEAKRLAELEAKRLADLNKTRRVSLIATLNKKPLRTTFVIKQKGKEIERIKGESSANLNLKPGRYQISTSYAGKWKTVNINLKSKNLTRTFDFFKKAAPPKVVNGQIRAYATLNGRPLNTSFVVTKNGKRVKVMSGRSSANFLLPPGNYVISTQFGGRTSRANVNLAAYDIAEQRFAFSGSAPAPNNTQKDWTHTHNPADVKKKLNKDSNAPKPKKPWYKKYVDKPGAKETNAYGDVKN